MSRMILGPAPISTYRIGMSDVSGQDISANQVVIPVTEIVKYVYRDVDDAITDAYNAVESNNSMICDIVAVYLKGQKLLYSEAKTFCEIKLNYLMLPAIFITVLGRIITQTLKDSSTGPIIVSGMNGFVAFLLAVVNYLKLDARAEAHRTTAYNFDKLESFTVFTSGRVMFLKGADMKQIIEDIEKKVREIKETNPFVLPEHIRNDYPNLCGNNVFAEVKKVQTREMLLINSLKDSLNEELIVKERFGRLHLLEDETRLKELTAFQERKTAEIIKMRDEYINIDVGFEDEIRMNRRRWSKYCQLCACLKV